MAYSPPSGPIAIASIRFTGAEEEFRHLARRRQRVAVGCHHVKGHAFDAELDEERGADVADAPELHFPGPDLHNRIDLPVDRDDFGPLPDLYVLDEEEPFRQVPQHGKKSIRPVNDESA